MHAMHEGCRARRLQQLDIHYFNITLKKSIAY
jgi:hypothetical protein